MFRDLKEIEMNCYDFVMTHETHLATTILVGNTKNGTDHNEENLILPFKDKNDTFKLKISHTHIKLEREFVA